jgi:hypothetical protein
MGKESNAVCFKPLSASTKEYAVFIADADLVSYIRPLRAGYLAYTVPHV